MSEVESLLVREIMTKQYDNVCDISSIDSVNSNVFERYDSGVLFIVDQDVFVGIITDGDLRRSIAKGEQDVVLKNAVATNCITILPDEHATVALRVLRENKINVLPVVQDKELLGYLSLHRLIDVFSPERLYLQDGVDDGYSESYDKNNVERHISRYNFASNFIRHDAVCVDCACGSGYGSVILSEVALDVKSFDIDPSAIEYALSHNARNNIDYTQSDIDCLQFDDSSVDAVVSIETLEHIPFESFLKWLSNVDRWLKRGGVFIGSSPMLRYKDGKPYITNPYHINEMDRRVFVEAVNNALSGYSIHYYYQDEDKFLPLLDENTGFCIVVARKC